MKLQPEYVREILDYNPENGLFTWRIRHDAPAMWNARWAGTLAGTDNLGYVYVKINYRHYAAHKLAWMHVYGTKPPKFIDHKNRDRTDNRIANLRAATATQNQGNRPVSRHSQTGIKGVTFDKSRGLWMARMNVAGSFKNLGRFATAELAKAAYDKAASHYFGEFARAA